MTLKYNIVNYDEESMEAEVIVSDGFFEILAFAHPCNKSQIHTYKLHLFEMKNIVVNSSKIENIIKTQWYFSHSITGKYYDNFVKIWEIILEWDWIEFPGDIKNGDSITFDCERIDLY